MNRRSAVAAINRVGALLVFPLDNRREPPSIWSHFYPKEEMRWEWDDDGDDRVSRLWHLRGALSTTRLVVYTKWFRGRATYLSRPLFVAMLRALNPEGDRRETLTPDARRLLETLEIESPLSTKELKRMAGFQGRAQERAYHRALQELWSRLLIVAYGEVDDGAFPSLAIGASRVIFEDLWAEAFALGLVEAERAIAERLPEGSLFLQHFLKLKARVIGTRAARSSRGGVSRRRISKVPSVVRFEDL